MFPVSKDVILNWVEGIFTGVVQQHEQAAVRVIKQFTAISFLKIPVFRRHVGKFQLSVRIIDDIKI